MRQCYYSVPARYVGRSLSVRLSGRTVEVLDWPKCVATHERAFGRYVEVLVLDHSLEVLETKPPARSDTLVQTVPTIGAATLGHLAAGGYMGAGEPVVLLGDSGTGKSRLLIGLGLAACEQGRRCGKSPQPS